MTESDSEVDHALSRRYEIRVDGDVQELAHRLSPTAELRVEPVCTVLWLRPAASADLDALLDALLRMGIAPYEVYESAPGVHRSAYCEVRIAGCLGEQMLHYLGWSHRVVHTTVVTVRATSEHVTSVLTELSAVSPVDSVLAR